MTDCFPTGLMPLAQAKALLFDAITAVSDSELINVTDALDRVLSEPVVASINVPPADNSAMDGYAVCDERGELTQFELIGTAYAGEPFQGDLAAGQAIRIMTGAILPVNATGVEMQENCQVQGQQLLLNGMVPNGQFIRQAGDDISIGSPVLAKGKKLNSVDIGLLASLGCAQVRVLRQLSVAIFSTGDELKTAEQTLRAGDIYESNRAVLSAMLSKMNIKVIDLGIITDNKTAIEQAFLQANQQADAVISSGGVSVGDADFTHQVLHQIGDVGFYKIAMKPGKPFAFGQLTNSYFFGLPGNPVSATVTFDQLVRPALELLSGQVQQHRLRPKARLTSPIKKRSGRADFQRGVASVDENGQLQVAPLSKQSSGVLSSMSQANCYLVLSAEQAGLEAGEAVTIALFDGADF